MCWSPHTQKEKKKRKGKKKASVTGGSSGDPAPADMSEKSPIRKFVWFLFLTVIFLAFVEDSRKDPLSFSGIRSQTKGTENSYTFKLIARSDVILDGRDKILI